MMRSISFEIENTDGDMMMAFEISIYDDGRIEITKEENCNLAEISHDYIFNTKNELYRIQKEK